MDFNPDLRDFFEIKIKETSEVDKEDETVTYTIHEVNLISMDFPKISKAISLQLSEGKLSRDVQELNAKVVSKILSKHGLTDTNAYEHSIIKGFYGDELDGVYIKTDILEKITDELHSIIYMPVDVKEKFLTDK